VRAFINACRHRGMQVASGSGCSRAFVCPYHAWTYDLEGKLKGIRGPEAFPEVNIEDHGLTEVSAQEKGGIVYVMQEGKLIRRCWRIISIILRPNKRCSKKQKPPIKRIGS
jgi:phenylpropionate dioxygenase-like ring-hydroxylating dioxygenase large terminal subunit